jgi:hypothetical protein
MMARRISPRHYYAHSTFPSFANSISQATVITSVPANSKRRLTFPHSLEALSTTTASYNSHRWFSSEPIDTFQSESTTDNLEIVTKTTSGSNGNNKNANKRRKPRGSKRAGQHSPNTAGSTTAYHVKLLQFQKVHTRNEVEEWFESLAQTTGLGKLKWMQQLEALLLAQKEDEETTKTKNSTTVSLDEGYDEEDTSSKRKPRPKAKAKKTKAKTTILLQVQTFTSRKSIPQPVKEQFWDLVVAKTTQTGSTATITAAAAAAVVDNEDDRSDNKKLPKIKKWKKLVPVLMKAREVSVEHPLLWSQTRKRKLRKEYKKRQQASIDAVACDGAGVDGGDSDSERTVLSNNPPSESYDKQRATTISNLHCAKSLQDLEEEAHVLAQALATRLPTGYYDKLMQLFRDYVEASEEDKGGNKEEEDEDDLDEIEDYTNQPANDSTLQKKSSAEETQDDESSAATAASTTKKQKAKPKKRRMRMLFAHIQKQTQSHVHLVASELADYFYINVRDGDGDQEEDDDDETTKTESSASSLLAATEEERNVATSDPRVVASLKAWKDQKAAFVDSFLTIQTKLVEEQELQDAQEEAYAAADATGEDDEEAQILACLQASAAEAPKREKKATKPIIKRNHLLFEAILTGGSWGSTVDENQGLFEIANMAEHSSLPAIPPTDRMIFIDNLPIDITEHRLMDAYSRCGPIESLQVFHQRPELDPGRRSKHSRKQIRKPSSTRRKWERPRTPLYAKVLFQDSQGYNKSLQDPLRIFGMVVDKHLIRSHRALDMTKLYLEDIAADEYSVSDIEYQLSQVLSPDLYVCLDDVSQRFKQKNRTGLTTCELTFPSFEATYFAYFKLRAELDLLRKDNDDNKERCALHWMTTPHDANMYWTRELNF